MRSVTNTKSISKQPTVRADSSPESQYGADSSVIVKFCRNVGGDRRRGANCRSFGRAVHRQSSHTPTYRRAEDCRNWTRIVNAVRGFEVARCRYCTTLRALWRGYLTNIETATTRHTLCIYRRLYRIYPTRKGGVVCRHCGSMSMS